MYGYYGIVALINLSNQSVEKVHFSEAIARKYIGGSGLGTYFLMKYSNPSIGTLDPENPLIIFTGPYTATGFPTSGRHQIITKSPLTGIFCESNAGGSFGNKLKKSGFDGLIIIGKADLPVYLIIDNGEISFESAKELWGLDTFVTSQKIKEKLSNNFTVSCIGLAGENLVPMASIVNDGFEARVNARAGGGAVMGSKKLKAIAVSGSKKVKFFNKDLLIRLSRKKNTELKNAGQGLNKYGSAGDMVTNEACGDLPIKNWKLGSWSDEVRLISGEKMEDTIVVKNYHCVACPIGCGKIVKFNDIYGKGPEYETMAMLGSNCLVSDLESLVKANDLCNRLGIDTISTGAAIAFAMELFELGIINEKDIGFSLQWGDGEALIKMVREIGLNKHFGIILGQGVKKAAQLIGKDSSEYAIHVKGLEVPAHDPRAFKGIASEYATSNRGACHLAGLAFPWERSKKMPELGYTQPLDRFSDEGKGQHTAEFQNLMSLADSLLFCKYSLIFGLKISEMIEALNNITGWEVNFEEFIQSGERIFNLKRLFNTSHGISRKDDILPDRISKETRKSGGAADSLPNLKKQLEEYYKFRKWNSEGIPQEEKLKELGLNEFINL